MQGERVQGEVAAVTGRPYFLLDVDGVLNLARFRSSKRRAELLRSRTGYFHRKPTDPYSEDRLLVNLPEVRAAVKILLESGAELAWATTWGAAANDYFVPLLGLRQVLPAAPVNFRLKHKASTVIPWTEGRPWAWLEDQEAELSLAHGLTGRDVPHLPVLVDRATGLTRAHAEKAAEWAKAL